VTCSGAEFGCDWGIWGIEYDADRWRPWCGDSMSARRGRGGANEREGGGVHTLVLVSEAKDLDWLAETSERMPAQRPQQRASHDIRECAGEQSRSAKGLG
jgi:hypothetical protein